MKKYWLVKQEPSAYSWDDFVRDRKTSWTGMRNLRIPASRRLGSIVNANGSKCLVTLM